MHTFLTRGEVLMIPPNKAERKNVEDKNTEAKNVESKKYRKLEAPKPNNVERKCIKSKM